MGREARCTCRCGQRSGRVTALLESGELILRGEFRARAQFTSLTNVQVRGDTLVLAAAGETIELDLGAKRAQSWAAALAAPPQTLAQKLGIAATTPVYFHGTIDPEPLRDALARANDRAPSIHEADVALIRTDDPNELAAWLDGPAAGANAPIWVVYRKGRGAPFGENGVREIMRARGLIDTKIARVSDELSALRFVHRKYVRLSDIP
jgi:hypothetical protein